jgi:hypothetical protein
VIYNWKQNKYIDKYIIIEWHEVEKQKLGREKCERVEAWILIEGLWEGKLVISASDDELMLLLGDTCILWKERELLERYASI